MNATNRGLGRVALVVVGLVLLVGGVGAILVQTAQGLPLVASSWRSVGDALAGLGTHTSRDDSLLSWTWVLGGGVVVGILAIVVLTTLGGGREGTVVESDGSADGVAGSVRIESTAVQHALSSAIGALPQVASLAVDVYRVRGTRAIRVRVHPRRGASPREITERVEVVVADLDALLGERLPVLLEIARGGAGSSRPDRVH
ncbi:hypothetical protein [Curtobacterium sp. VKM Ac-1393]|uniref:hypothetical protein n=1 Tax=Curtobacterium sp. VKM Ac-1393 TaxID=2783814 RepID=UPI001889C56B|nr:hypothetical protein [Curtobacterium sp. VKM Ac-1393]MBF4606124.1 hypothetical protein [Curtobacterium sp. VKM Ac-1393]